MARVQSLVQEFPHASGVAEKKNALAEVCVSLCESAHVCESSPVNTQGFLDQH